MHQLRKGPSLEFDENPWNPITHWAAKEMIRRGTLSVAGQHRITKTIQEITESIKISIRLAHF